MNTQFEVLPNELLVDVFEYLDAEDLFQTFYHLNIRFNTVLQSLNHLSLTLTQFDIHQTIHSYINLHCVQTIVVNHRADVNLNDFPNLRRLKFSWPHMRTITSIRFCSLATF